MDQATTKAQLERVAANVRKLDGVRDAKVVEVTGLWFTVSATRLAVVTNGRPEDSPAFDPNVMRIHGTASGGGQDATGRPTIWIRGTYIGPSISRADFDLMRRGAAETLHIDIDEVVVTELSATSPPTPTKS
jgi:hypothetical protein